MSGGSDLTHPPLDKMAAISQTVSSDAFSWMNSLYLDYSFTEVFFLKHPIYNNPVLVQIMA